MIMTFLVPDLTKQVICPGIHKFDLSAGKFSVSNNPSYNTVS